MDSITSLIVEEFGPSSGNNNDDEDKDDHAAGRFSPTRAQRCLLPTFLASVDKLLQRAWFYRIWVLQEAVLAPEDPTTLYGEKSITWDDFWSALLSIWKLAQEAVVQERHLLNGLSSVTFIAQLRFDWKRGEGSLSDVLSIVARSRVRETTDPRDKIYGLLGLLKPEVLLDAGGFAVDYNKSVELVYEEFAVWFMDSTKSLDVLNYSYNAASTLSLSSWVPDWSIPTAASLCWDAPPSLYNTSGNHPFRFRYVPSSLHRLHLTGLEIDTVKSVVRLTHGEGEMEDPTSETWAEWRALARTAYSYGSGTSEEPFWRTVVADKKPRTGRADNETGLQYHAWLLHEHQKAVSAEEEEEEEEETRDFSEFLRTMSFTVLGRRLFVTERGFLRIADGGIHTDDGIFIVYGGSLCFILRRIDEAKSVKGDDVRDVTYRLINSGAYVHGLADGEAFNIAQTEGLEL
ncbi:hypothetical protein MMC14_007742 [Varicellaria rhodocarpa]|nr:hypothetical protein [Varicellaria rhodocarpa]